MPAALLAVAFLALSPTDNPVLTAAKKRQDAIRSIEVLCTITEVRKPFSDTGGKTPTEQTTRTWRERIVFDGIRSRLETRISDYGDWLSVIVCDGALIKTLRGMVDERAARLRKGTIQRIVLCGRSTCFCPRCQPRPRQARW